MDKIFYVVQSCHSCSLAVTILSFVQLSIQCVEEYKSKGLSLYRIPCLRQNVPRTEITLPTAATPMLVLVLVAIVVRIVEVAEVLMNKRWEKFRQTQQW